MKTAYQDSGNGSIHSNSAPVAKGGDAKIEDRTGLYISIIALVLAAFAVGSNFVMPRLYEAQIAVLKDRVESAERTALQLREDIRVQAIALARAGINTDEHAVEKGEK